MSSRAEGLAKPSADRMKSAMGRSMIDEPLREDAANRPHWICAACQSFIGLVQAQAPGISVRNAWGPSSPFGSFPLGPEGRIDGSEIAIHVMPVPFACVRLSDLDA